MVPKLKNKVHDDTESAETYCNPGKPSSSNSKSNSPVNQYDFERRRCEYLFDPLPAFLRLWVVKNVLRDQDENHIHIFLVIINVLLTSLPMVFGLFYLEGKVPTLLFLVLGLAFLLFHLSSFAAGSNFAMHNQVHKSIFNKKFRVFDKIFERFICLLFGFPPFVYYPHHVAMHHVKDNVAPFDISSTWTYRRDSKLARLHYILRFMLLLWLELPLTMIRLGRPELALQCLMGESIFATICFVAWQIGPISTVFVFLLPNLVIKFLAMDGNFKQHIFVDPDDPENPYKFAYNIINNDANGISFNDGYHIEHHVNSQVPWFQMPQEFLKNLPKHAANDSFIFSGIDGNDLSNMIDNGRLDQLADHYVNIGQPQRTKEELVAEFRRRLVPISLDRSAATKY